MHSRRQIAVLTLLGIGLATGTAVAQECLHGANESAEQIARRREALTATRLINTIQASRPAAATGLYLRYEELADSPFGLKMRESTNETMKRISLKPQTEILPNWQLTLDVTEKGYWFMIKDTVDPCGFAYISNQTGLIFRAEPIR